MKLPRVESQSWAGYTIDSGCGRLIRDNYQRNLEQMARFLSAYGVPLMIVLQPEKNWKQPWWSEEEAQDAQRVLKDLPWYDRAVRAIYPGLSDAAQRAGAAFGLHVADLRPVFRDRTETMFVDPVHMNDRGNEIVAQALAGYVMPVLPRAASR